jgi:hypothetical protein
VAGSRLNGRLMLVLILLCSAFAASGAAAQTVLFDNGHGERFKIDDKGPLQLSGLAEIVKAAGSEVGTLDQPISDQTLKGADALVISGAFRPVNNEEIQAVLRFLKRGGKVAIMLHIAPPLANLLDSLQIRHTNGVIQERDNLIEDQPLNFRVTHIADHPVVNRIREFSAYGVWGLINIDQTARIVASTGPNAWIDLHQDKKQTKENTSSFGVIVAGEMGLGGYIVFGDDAIFQNKFLDPNNKALAANLAAWLK